MRNYLKPYTTSNLSTLIDDFFNRDMFPSKYNQTGNYTVEKLSQDTYRLTVNVAGFAKENIDITVNEGTLHISGNISSEKHDKKDYLYNGFSSSFSNYFTISEDAEILSAEIKDGLLKIDIKEHLPKKNEPKKISIR